MTPVCLRAAANQFIRTGQYECSVSDSQKKSLVLLSDSMELHAVTLQGGNGHRKGPLTRENPAQNSTANAIPEKKKHQKKSPKLLRVATVSPASVSALAVHLNMSTYAHPAPGATALPVALNIKGTNLFLSCHREGERPALHLEPVEDQRSLTSVAADGDTLRFLFYKRDSGVSLSTLASARFPKWFISTAEGDDMPMEMCQRAANRFQ